MATANGALTLQTPEDLLLKLRHDLKRLASNPLDAYAAFDFFVTAKHYPEWLRKAGRPTKQLRRSSRDRAIQLVVDQIANGAKHFFHKTVQEGSIGPTSKRDAWVEPGWMQPDMYDAGALLIELKGNLVHQLGAITEAHLLAKEVMQLLERTP